MRRFGWIASVVFGLVLPAAASAESAGAAPAHVVSEEQLVAAVDAAAVDTARLRESVSGVLARPETAALARDLGIDAQEIAGQMALLDGPELEQLAAQARLADACLAGGDKLSIEYTTLIIGLLVLIVVLLLVK